MHVMKFGGTSVQDAEAIRRVIEIVRTQQNKIIVVVSAFATITNRLSAIIDSLKQQDIEIANDHIDYIYERHLQILGDLELDSDEINSFVKGNIDDLRQIVYAANILSELTPKSTDSILSFGERLSSYIVYQALQKNNLSIAHIDARDIIKTSSEYTEAEIDLELTRKLVQQHCIPLLDKFKGIIMGGYIASDQSGNTTTLGRGGSDYSAAIIASAVNADCMEIWTDVDGIMTSDPRIIPDAKQILNLTYEEAAELAYFGARVLHPKTIYPAVEQKIPVVVRNTFNPEFEGTRIIDVSPTHQIIKAIAFRRGITIINISSNRMLGAYGFLSKVFDVFKKHETSVDLVSTSEVSISLTVDDARNLPLIMAELKKFADISVQKEMSIISAVGEGIRNTAGIAARFFGVLQGINISMVSIGASEINLSIVVDEANLEDAVRLLHNEFLAGVTDPEIFYQSE